MSNFEVTGKIFKKLDQRSGTSARGEWVSQDFVLEFQDGNFPTNVSLSAWGKDRVAELNSFKEGDTVTVAFNIRGREYNGKWYNDLRAWRISAAQSSQPQAQQSVPSQPAQAPQSQAPAPTMDDMQTSIPEDDLPF